MDATADHAVAIVGLGAVLPDARNVAEFWSNVKQGRYSISEVPPDRWDPALYYDPDPKEPDKTYSRIGGWVRQYEWDPIKWRLPIPPKVSDAMDGTQKWGLGCALQALADYGYPRRPIDLERTGVILGNAMGGEQHYRTALRTALPELARQLDCVPAFTSLAPEVREAIRTAWRANLERTLPVITEDTMPGELSNCIAGRLANLLNLRGPNFVVDAACASAMAAFTAAVEGLTQKRFDAVITGGIDRNMGASTFIKFCKIHALSATGSRPFGDGADGFVMGEGAALFLMKRLADAERDGDRIYAVLRGVGGASDGKGKGITAPNPIGQRLSIARAWENAGLQPSEVGLVEGHGTSTAVGDLVEVESLIEVFGKAGCARGSVPLGSVKSNIGHLKSAAGAAGVLKAVLALDEKVIPPTANFEKPNTAIDFTSSPFHIATTLRPWDTKPGQVRQAGVSAFGFGGTNFHVVLEEHVPGRLAAKGRSQVGGGIDAPPTGPAQPAGRSSRGGSVDSQGPKAPMRGALLLGGTSERDLAEQLRVVAELARAGTAPPFQAPAAAALEAPERIAIDYANSAELADRASRALAAFEARNPALWKMLRSQGVFRGRKNHHRKIAFLYTGQGSQYVNMLARLRDTEPVVAETFAEADGFTRPLLGKPISEYLFVPPDDKDAMAQAEEALKQTAITQPAVLAVDMALTRLLETYGVKADMVMGHSLGEYGALVAAGAMPFGDALEAVSARGREMTRVSVEDAGWMVAVFAPLEEIERILATVDGYVVIANLNSKNQAVIGGASRAVEQAMLRFQQAGHTAMRLPVSHAFHTAIVAPASEPMKRQLDRLHLAPPRIPIVSNVTGEFYPMDDDARPQMLELLGRQVASPVQFVKGLQTLYDAGARTFIEVGPKKALQGFAESAFDDRDTVLSLYTNHPKLDDGQAFNQALCGAYAMGHGHARLGLVLTADPDEQRASVARPMTAAVPAPAAAAMSSEFLTTPATADAPQPRAIANDRPESAGRPPAQVRHPWRGLQVPDDSFDEAQSVLVTGASIGLPGTPRVFDDDNVGRLVRGQVFIGEVPPAFREAMVEKRITRLVKSDAGEPRFEVIDHAADVIKLAGRAGELKLAEQFGIPADRLPALDRVTRLAIGAGLDALRDAGIPLVQHYKTTTKGTLLPERWGLPDSLRDDTGVIFTSAFPGCDSFADIISGYYRDRIKREQLGLLEELRGKLNGDAPRLRDEIDARVRELSAAIEANPYVFDRRFLLRVLAMGHSQFAELIGARGPNTQINSACASSTLAFGLAQDWINTGRCRRVIVVGADDITSDNLLDWFGAGFLASGAAATDARVEDAALPFDRRRHGLIIGMGAAGVVIERADAVRERGLQPICEVVHTAAANSAFHGTRLDVEHIVGIMEKLISETERKTGVSRHVMASSLMFVSHETYTPARGGSASAEVAALRRVFGESADRIVVANTKGYTGHPMAVGIEDVLAIKALETGLVPPVAHFRDVDPELGPLNLSRGGSYPIHWTLRLGAGFGSQVSFSVMRWTPMPDCVRRPPEALGYSYRIVDRPAWEHWLGRMSGQPSAELEVVCRTLRVKVAGKRTEGPKAKEMAARSEGPKVVAERAEGPKVRPSTATRGALSAVDGRRPEGERPTAAPAPVLSPVTVAQPAATVTVAATVSAPATAIVAPAVAAVAVAGLVRQPVPTAMGSSAGLQTRDRATQLDVLTTLLGLVVEKTGYPAEMLDPDLDLEADLGIDTVKQAELMAAIRGLYDIPRDENLKLRDFPTLKHVVEFVYRKRPDLNPAVHISAASAAPTGGTPPEMPSAASAVSADTVSAVSADTVSAASADTVSAGSAAPTGGMPVPPVMTTLLGLVVEKTGYPAEMLDPDLDLEADLGIDTVKQAELMAAIRGLYDIPRDENLKLRDFPTLKHVVEFVYRKRPDLNPAVHISAASAAPTGGTPEMPSAASAVSADTVSAASADTVSAGSAAPTGGMPVPPVMTTLLGLVVEKTGYPAEMLDPDLDLEADLGIDTVKQAELMAAIRGLYDIPRDENLKLRDFPTLKHVVEFVYRKRPDLNPAVHISAASAAPTGGTPEMPSAASAVSADTVSAASADTVSAGSAAPTGGMPVPPVMTTLLGLVVEKTGYPAEMLDPDLDLEADLGIDTVKQAELMAAIRGLYDIPRDENLKLRDFPTLKHVVEFVYRKRPDLNPAVHISAASAAPTGGTPPEMPSAASAVSADTVSAASADTVSAGSAAPTGGMPVPPVMTTLLGLVVEKTGYPAEMLDPDLDLEADLGIDTVKQAELMAAIRGLYDIPRDENLKLRDFPTLKHVVEFVYRKRPDLNPAVHISAASAAPTGGTPEMPSAASAVSADTVSAASADTVSAGSAAPTGGMPVPPVMTTLLGLVVEKTGYPAEMLDPDLDLEADLGIDTVKQAELMAAIRGLYDIPRDENLKLRDFPTLKHVVEFVYRKRPDLNPAVHISAASAAPTGGTPPEMPSAASAGSAETVSAGSADIVSAPSADIVSAGSAGRSAPALRSFDAANAIPRRVPTPVLRPPLAFCKPTGVSLEPGRRVIVMADQNGVAGALAASLAGRGVLPLVIEPHLPEERFGTLLHQWLDAGPVSGVYWLPALDREPALSDMTLQQWREGLRVRVKQLHRTLRALYSQMDRQGAFLVAATRMGGHHGYDERGALAPMGGAVAGFVKAFSRERPRATVKVVDFGSEPSPAIAEALIAETLGDPAVVEIGYADLVRWGIGLEEARPPEGATGTHLTKDTVFVVTGAAGSIVSAIVGDLAAASGGVFYLLDRVPEPDPANPDLKMFEDDRDGLKRAIAARLKAGADKVTPVMVERELAAIERAHAAMHAIRTVEACGGLALYLVG